MQISYEQALAAHERGEKVEMRSILGLSWVPFIGQKLGRDYEFRLAPVPASEEVPCPRMKEVNYAQAVNAFAQGISVECTRDNRKTWEKVIEWKGWQGVNAWRINDPYAELKAAGKTIQFKGQFDKDWIDTDNPLWDEKCQYRVKPDEPLKFEAGKWRLRNGREAKVYEAYPDVIHGAILTNSGTWGIQLWGTNGRIDGVPEWDLIAPWTGTPAPYDNWQHLPAWAQWQARTRDGAWIHGDMNPSRTQWGWVSQGWESHIPLGFEPTNFTGTWEESLQERPKL